MTVHCIKCGEADTVRVDLSDGKTLTCTSCDDSYTVDDVGALLKEWGELLAWLAAHPRTQK